MFQRPVAVNWHPLYLILILMTVPTAAADDYQLAVEAIQSVGSKASGHEQAMVAVQDLSAAPMDALPIILQGIRDGEELTNNWLRGAAQSVLDRHTAEGGKPPVAWMKDYLADETNSSTSRFAVFELFQESDPQTARSLIPSMLDDSCLDLRRMAVAQGIEDAEGSLDEDPQAALEQFKVVLASARDADQVEAIAKHLADLEADVDLIKHFGFVTTWHLAGPFDHGGSKRKTFDTPYPPEESTPDLTAEYDGKDGKVRWVEYTTDDNLGIVDLNKALANHKGAIVYAYVAFISHDIQDIEIRLGCINANKVWLNGDLLTENEVYHANTSIDQYMGQGQLKAGENAILLKIAQNEQSEGWAQRWQFQIRVCDALGTPVLSAEEVPQDPQRLPPSTKQTTDPTSEK